MAYEIAHSIFRTKIKVNYMQKTGQIKANTNEEIYTSDQSKRKTANELFESISRRVREMYDNQITEAESMQAARNFINFCQLIIDCNLKQQKIRKRRE